MTRQKTAHRIAERHLRRSTSMRDLLCEEEFRADYDGLVAAIALERQSYFHENKKSAHPELLQEIAAEAGFLIGLEMGRRLVRRELAR